MIPCICIDDSHKPNEIPNSKWVKKFEKYHVIYTITVLPQRILAFHLSEIELTENEWARACILRERYWLYAVFDCGGTQPRLLRVQDPFAKLIARARGSVAIGYSDIANASEAAE